MRALSKTEARIPNMTMIYGCQDRELGVNPSGEAPSNSTRGLRPLASTSGDVVSGSPNGLGPRPEEARSGPAKQPHDDGLGALGSPAGLARDAARRYAGRDASRRSPEDWRGRLACSTVPVRPSRARTQSGLRRRASYPALRCRTAERGPTPGPRPTPAQSPTSGAAETLIAARWIQRSRAPSGPPVPASGGTTARTDVLRKARGGEPQSNNDRCDPARFQEVTLRLRNGVWLACVLWLICHGFLRRPWVH
jgi:hypothetical protein